MSPKILPSTLGLAALGTFWVALAAAQDPSEPAPARRTAVANAPSPTVHLLSHGRVLKGKLTEHDSTHYSIKQKAGSFQFPKEDLVQSFASLQAMYEYRRAQFPENDPDEHMRLARWCLTEGLSAQTRRELADVLELIPDHREARAMIEKLDFEAERAEMRNDDAVMTASATVERSPLAERARTIDPIALQAAKRELGMNDSLAIFNLPPAQAVKRAQEFNDWVHPILQRQCAGCHNEKYDGRFRMVQVQGRRRLRGEEFRVNLDAALQLVNPEEPETSELLTRALMPHKSTKRAVLTGQNDPSYRILSTWVQHIKAGTQPVESRLPKSLEPAEGSRPTPVGQVPPPAPKRSGFASDRLPRGAANSDQSMNIATDLEAAVAAAQNRQPPPLPPEQPAPNPPGRMIPGSYSGPAPLPPPGTAFPTNEDMTAQLSKSHRQSEAKADPRLPDEGSAKAAAGSKKASDIPDPVSLGIKTDPKSAKTKTKPEAEKKKRKPKTFDLDAYSEIMIKRNGARAPH